MPLQPPHHTRRFHGRTTASPLNEIRPQQQCRTGERSEGLAMDTIVEGTLYAWARTNVGDWLASVTFSIPTGNKMGRLDLDRQWVPADAVTPRP